MTQQKHAYLIMAHDNYYCLEKLLMLLDDARNDIFLHIDAKVKNFDFDHFRSLCKNAQVIYPKKRINVRWGTQSQVKTEMLLFKTAVGYGPYHYYHLISGVDLPIKSQNSLHKWFQDKTSSYLYYSENANKWDIQRVSRYHFTFGSRHPLLLKINGAFARVQERLGVDRVKGSGLVIRKGSNWASLTQKAAECLLANKSTIMKLTRFSVCADEIYKQTILLHNNLPVVCNDLRMIVWESGSHPHTYRTADYEMLCNTDRFFARKFSEKVDRQIIDMIERKVRGESKCAAR